MKYRILLPFLLQLFDGKPLEQVLLSPEITFQGRYQQGLSESTRTTQNIDFAVLYKMVYQLGLVNIDKAIRDELLKTLYSYRIFFITMLDCFRQR